MEKESFEQGAFQEKYQARSEYIPFQCILVYINDVCISFCCKSGTQVARWSLKHLKYVYECSSEAGTNHRGLV